MPNINELLSQHVTLEVECLDRLYLNGYIPTLQTGGQLVRFLVEHRGKPIPSPVLLKQITDDYKSAVARFAQEQGLELVHFEPKQRKDTLAAEHRAAATTPEGVYLIGVAQEKASAFKAQAGGKAGAGHIHFDWDRQSVCVNHYYFYLQDADFGPAFVKVGTYAPYPMKVYLNGHEWVKHQLQQEGIAFEALDNGFLSCADPERLQAVCDLLGPEQIQAFRAKWLARLPLPLTPDDQVAGYDWRLSIWQMEVSRTQVFDEPLRGREFFEEIIRENLDLGRPDRVQLVFDRRVVKQTPGCFRTRVIQEGVSPSLHLYYKHCEVTQYFKEHRALRTETTIHDTGDFGFGKDLSNLRPLQGIGRSINRRLLDVQRVSQECTLSRETVEAVTQPTVTSDGQRASGLRFGDPRVMALFWALTLWVVTLSGFTHGALRGTVIDLLGPDTRYGAAQMTYDLRRLCRKGILQRKVGSHRYTLTPYGRRVVLFFTKLDARVFRPAFAAIADAEPIPRPLATALKRVDQAITRLLDKARLTAAA